MSQTPVRSGSRPAAVLIGIAAVVIIMLLLAGVLRLGQAGADVPTASPSPTASGTTPLATSTPVGSPSASVAASATPVVNLATWQIRRLPQPVQSYGGAWPQAAVEAGPGFVAVGFMTPCCADATYESEPWMSVVWTSPNGVDWEVLPDLETFRRSGLRSIAVDEAGSMLAVGYEVLPPPDDAVGGDSFVRAGRAWRSDNGRDWYPVGSLGGEDLFEVIWTQSGWYVAGQGDGEATIWHSTDLATWDAWSLGERGWFERLAAGADGTLVAIACIKGADLGCHTTVFADPGAEGAWKRAEELGVPRDVIAWGDGFAAVGSDRDVTRGLAWLSQDGVTWQASEIGDGLIPWTVADVDGVLVAGGEALAQEAAYEPAVWRSVDGVHWLPAATLEAYADQAGGNVGVIIGARRGITAMGSGYAGTGTALTWIEAP